MPIPSQIKEIPSRRSVRPDFSVIRRSDPDNDPTGLRVLAHVHSYPPVGLAGAPITLHHLMKRGDARGWTTRVVVESREMRSDDFEGIPVRNDYNVRTINMDYTFSRVVITHLNNTRKAVEMSRRAGRPLVHLVHNERQLSQYDVLPRDCALAIFNSHWLSEAVNWPGRSVVCHPYTPIEDYWVPETGDAVTLINVAESKGADLFFELAHRNPGVRFIGVKGGYGDQVSDARIELPNVEIWEPQTDMKTVYAQTRLLVMPSWAESWGRTAVEAGCSGIPSICADVSGLRETEIGELYLSRDFDLWNKAVRRYTRGANAWAEASEKAIMRATALDEQILEELNEACEAIESLV